MGAPLKVLIVEDSEDDAELLVHALRHGGLDSTFERIETAAEMRAALEGKDFDIVLVDYALPHFSVPEALKVFEESGLDLPFIVVSGVIRMEDAVALMKSGAHDFIRKDELTRLVPAVEREVRESKTRRKRKEAEEEIYKLNVELEERVRSRTAALEAANGELEAFNYAVSHDLRAPLRAIDGFSLILLEDYADKLDEKGRHSVERVRAGTQLMGELIDDLLKLSRATLDEQEREDVDLSELARSIAARLKESQPERDVTFDIASGVTANGKERLLRVVLENLLGNAWKFTGKKKQARIEFGVTDQEGKPVYFVRDNGAGFDMTYADKLFVPFQRLHGKKEFEGHGIGLSTVQRIIHRHGGEVWAEAGVGNGASFYFSLSHGD